MVTYLRGPSSLSAFPTFWTHSYWTRDMPLRRFGAVSAARCLQEDSRASSVRPWNRVVVVCFSSVVIKRRYMVEHDILPKRLRTLKPSRGTADARQCYVAPGMRGWRGRVSLEASPSTLWRTWGPPRTASFAGSAGFLSPSR
ncbi:hypothetical protein NDU88_002870 [Pleurodeles waltl]|uniref:Uncharacterized protein n=1 Tax=Pleurodeles waltl TaxID=8319 RepID=A0AAV7P9J5_PLEWA|nr:hypothetical protein NDU88_002870 [Pleurodeles waltl]